MAVEQDNHDGAEVGDERRCDETSPPAGASGHQQLADTPQHRVEAEDEQEAVEGEGLELGGIEGESDWKDQETGVLQACERGKTWRLRPANSAAAKARPTIDMTMPTNGSTHHRRIPSGSKRWMMVAAIRQRQEHVDSGGGEGGDLRL